MDKELKACPLPFCGGPVQFHKDDDCAGCHLIECQSCKTLFDLATKADPYNQADSIEELQHGIAYLWNLPAQLPSQRGEAVEVVGYGCAGQIEVLKHVPLTGGMKVSGRDREKYNVPLMTVSQHQRILLSTVIRCEQKGAFKTCLECGYQDGHDLICQYHESKRAAVSDDLTNVRCLCCQSEHAHNSYDAGFIAGSGMCQACDSALPAKDIVSTTHPAGQVADDLTMVKVSRELLEQLLRDVPETNLCARAIRALLAKP